MRMIDGDALDEFLQKAEIDAEKAKKYVLRSAINTIRGNLTNFPTVEPEQRWIPVEERLPEEEGQYLVTKSRAGKKGVDFAIYFEIYEWNTADPVVAWMPLPKPYQAERSGE